MTKYTDSYSDHIPTFARATLHTDESGTQLAVAYRPTLQIDGDQVVQVKGIGDDTLVRAQDIPQLIEWLQEAYKVSGVDAPGGPEKPVEDEEKPEGPTHTELLYLVSRAADSGHAWGARQACRAVIEKARRAGITIPVSRRG